MCVCLRVLCVCVCVHVCVCLRVLRVCVCVCVCVCLRVLCVHVCEYVCVFESVVCVFDINSLRHFNTLNFKKFGPFVKDNNGMHAPCTNNDNYIHCPILCVLTWQSAHA